MSDRKHNFFLNIIAVGLGLDGLFLLQAALLDDLPGFAMVLYLFFSIITLAIARGFWKRKGWAFLLVSVQLLMSWMGGLIMTIVQMDHGGWGDASIYAYGFLGTNVLIAYLGRRSMEERFRPHLIVH